MTTDDPPEQWRPIPTWERYYLASDQGAIWSVRLGRPLKQAIKKASGRHQVTLMVSPRREDCLVADLVCQTFNGPRPDGLNCLHIDGDVNNNRPTNLRWGTQSDNIFDEVTHNTHRNSRKTHCPREHPYVDGNIIYNDLANGSTSRNCKSCRYARSRATCQGWELTPDLFKRLSDEYADRFIPGWRTMNPSQDGESAA